MKPKWLEWAQKLQAIAQTGLTFSENPYDIERFQSIQAIAAEILATHTNAELSYILDLFDRDVSDMLLPKLMCVVQYFATIVYY